MGLLLLFMSVFFSVAQDKKQAAEWFENGAYEQALEEYLELYETDSSNVEYAYRIAVCYLNTNIDKSLAVGYLNAVESSKGAFDHLDYLLGRAHHYAYDFDRAIEYFTRYKSKGKGSEENIKSIDLQIEYCQNAKELMKFPKAVTFQNLGRNVNSAYPDYAPFAPIDESFILFNSKRDDGSVRLSNRSYASNIYVSEVSNGVFAKAQKINANINTNEYNEEVVGLNLLGDQAIFYLEDFQDKGALYLGRIAEHRIDALKKMDDVINSKYHEIAATITKNQDKIFFASNRPGGYGGVDLYMCQRLPNGKWSQAQNLGPAINTQYDEDYPSLSPDGKTLYFSSKGHASMGGYDIFQASWNASKQKFGSVQNMGYPINTPEDNMNFTMSESGKYGYISALRKGGYGDLDLYRINFEDVEPRYTVITGKVFNSKTNKGVDGAFLSVVDTDTGEHFGDYTPNNNSQRYVMILPPGKYELLVEVEGYEEHIEEIKILDKSSFRSHMEKDIPLKAD